MVLVFPFLLSKDPLLLWSMEVCINVGKCLLYKVPKGFPDSNARIILYFVCIFWWNVNTVRQFCYWYVSISQFEKTTVKVLQGLVLANCHVCTELEDSEESPKGALFIAAAVM